MNADPPAPVDGAAIAEHRADMAPVQRAIAALPQDQRVAFALYHAGELSIAEIAVALDVPPGTVKTRLMHARRKIRAALEPKGDQDVQQ
jgi:RNA polymerase sigma-70 factor (ECF subfamily)